MDILVLGKLVLISLLWGGTNPFIRRFSTGIKQQKHKSKSQQFLSDVKYLLLNYKYLFSMAVNWSGSVLYFFTLQNNVDLSLVVPVTNSLTFAFTAVVGLLLGEQPPSKKTLLGVGLVLCGTTVCYLSKPS